MEPQGIVVGTIPGGATSMGARPIQMMGFMDAIKTCITEKYVDFSGRASRSEFWWFQLFMFLLQMGLFVLQMVALFSFPEIFTAIYWMTVVVSLGLFLPSLSVSVRRLHDIGKSGWYFLLIIPLSIICIGIILWIVWMISEGELTNQYGPPPTNQVS
tara:strand:- start:3791 stop:4261 length:471 start_codon:yes stop_codon:yes gene_type:complete